MDRAEIASDDAAWAAWRAAFQKRRRDDAIRANLTLSAMRVPASAREATLKHLLQREPMHGVGSVIVYVAFQNQAETVAAYLQTNGVNAKAYHAGQEPKDRQRTQAQFFAGSVRVVVALSLIHI